MDGATNTTGDREPLEVTIRVKGARSEFDLALEKWLLDTCTRNKIKLLKVRVETKRPNVFRVIK